MKFSIDKQDKYVVFTLEEERLHTLNAPDVKSEMVVLNSEGLQNIILDLSVVNFVDSSGLSAILTTNRLCKAINGNLILTGVQENVKKLIQISQLDSILTIIPTVQEAIETIK